MTISSYIILTEIKSMAINPANRETSDTLERLLKLHLTIDILCIAAS
jgi:hypothetical protein